MSEFSFISEIFPYLYNIFDTFLPRIPGSIKTVNNKKTVITSVNKMSIICIGMCQYSSENYKNWDCRLLCWGKWWKLSLEYIIMKTKVKVVLFLEDQ